MLGLDMMADKRHSRGFSLVELMVAMVVGVIIVSGAFSLHSGTRKVQMINEAQMDMVADARFAIEMIAYDLRHAGMWGGTNKAVLIDCKSTDAACVSTSSGDTPPSAMATTDCATGWYYDLSRSVFAVDQTDPNPYTSCIPGSEGHVTTTDILEMRYADSNVPAALLANQAYVRSNFITGRIFIGSTQPVVDSYDADPITSNHELHAYVYYVSNFTDAVGDGIPSLRRVALVNGPALQNQTLISGVSDLQVQFGEDVDGDLEVDRYVNPNDVIDWTAVYAAKIWLLMRSDKKQQGVDTKKDFTIAGVTKPGGYGGQDDYRYFLVTSVVNLRNLKQL
jgi:type IV pilus assembly protein PilW